MVLPVALALSAPELIQYCTTPVAERSVENVILALVLPDNSAFILEGREIRFNRIEVDPVFPARSVAITVIVLLQPLSDVSVLDQVPDPSVAREPLTSTLAMSPESDVVPEIVDNHVTVLPLA